MGRTGREAFLWTVALIYFLPGVVFMVLGIAYLEVNPYTAVDFEDLGGTLDLLVSLPLLVFQVLKRLRDFNRPWWHIFALLIPLWWFVELFKLFFAKGDEEPNRFGARTPQHSFTLRRNSWLLTASTAVSFFLLIWWVNSIEVGANATKGDCFTSTTTTEEGLLKGIEIIACSGDWDYKVSDIFDVYKAGVAYPGVDYFEEVALARCPTDMDWYLYPFPRDWQSGDGEIWCLQEAY
jgi:uncharacterized membrane protein YhaH (DUF805 family)